jgi:hypothetical protein
VKPGVIYAGLTGLTLVGWIVMLVAGVDVPPEYAELAKLMPASLVGILIGFQRGKKAA